MSKVAKPAQTKAFLSPTENVMVGIVGGCTETCLQMPLLTWKFAIQEGRPLPSTIGGYYRGLFAQAGSIAPITGLQVVAYGGLERIVSGGTRDLLDSEKIALSIGAGMFSALLYSPVDLVTIHQQKLGKAPLPTVKHLYSNFGFKGLFRGFSSCAVREGIYTCGYLGLTPVFSGKFKTAKVFESDLLCTLGGSIASGIVASIFSHPVDTIKTIIQADMEGKKFANSRVVFTDLVKNRGITSLYLGGGPRLIRNCGAFFIVAMIRNQVVEYKTKLEGL